MLSENGIDTIANVNFKSGEAEGASAERIKEEYRILRENLMTTFETKLAELNPAIQRNRQMEKSRKRPVCTVVLPMWEEDDTLFTTTMFERALPDILHQAQEAGIDLDVIMIANNGGGKTPELGKKMQAALTQFIEGNSESYITEEEKQIMERNGAQVRTIRTKKPAGEINTTTPWDFEANINDLPRKEGTNRFIIVDQEFTQNTPTKPGERTDYNAGMLRAIRDVVHQLHTEIIDVKNHYAPDLLYCMNAETILEFRDSKLAKSIPPFKAMANAILREGYKAVGSKDRFEILDREKGLPIDTPREAMQVGFEINSREWEATVPGGSTLARPEVWIAGMEAISANIPGNVAEDYLFSRLLNEKAARDGKGDIAKSFKTITHLNRYEPGAKAIIQMDRWKKAAEGPNYLFPEHAARIAPFTEHLVNVVKARIANFLKTGDTTVLRQLGLDVASIPQVLEALKETGPEESMKTMMQGSNVFSHNVKQ